MTDIPTASPIGGAEVAAPVPDSAASAAPMPEAKGSAPSASISGVPQNDFERTLMANTKRALSPASRESSGKFKATPASAPDPLAQAESIVRNRFKAERVSREKSDAKLGRESGGWRNGLKGGVADSMETAAALAKARETDDAAAAMPFDAKQSLDDRLRAAIEWHSRPEEERRAIKAAHDMIAEQRKQAEALGITPQEMEARAAKAGNDQMLQRVAALVPGENPQAVIDRFLTTLQTNPAAAQAALRNFTARTTAPARAQAAREAAMGRAVQGTISAFAASRPDFQSLSRAIEQALNSGQVARTGNVARDLAAAYKFVGGRHAA